MARIAYFQPFHGISGDMTLGALVDAGLPLQELEAGLRGLPLSGWRLDAREVLRGALRATRLRVLIERPVGEGHSHHHEHGEEPGHHHDHAHEHDHGHQHEHRHVHGHEGAAPARRSLSTILEIIGSSRLPAAVKEMAGAVFRRLGAAEARIHGIELEDVHFHEVGAVDSIVDITGSCLGLHLLGVEDVHSAPVAIGTGFISTEHGRLPLPGPAALELLKGFPVHQLESGAELTTPTGAALLTTLARSFGTLPPSRPLAIGYGAGDDRPGPIPNALRVILAETASPPAESDRVLLLETCIDDMSPQWLGHLMERLFAAGALDVFLAPVLMKKSRPGQQLSVIAPLDREPAVADTLFLESTTFGVRRMEVERLILEREIHPLETPWGEVRIKVGRRGGKETCASPEYEDLRRAAAAAGLPLREVHQRVLEMWRSR
jgi:uncharacterized protein (TIGR00299 family) protein